MCPRRMPIMEWLGDIQIGYYRALGGQLNADSSLGLLDPEDESTASDRNVGKHSLSVVTFESTCL